MIRYQLAELITKAAQAVNSALPQPRFKRGCVNEESNPALLRPCFKHDLSVLKKEV